MNLYRIESSYPDSNAQRNLSGRTHYVDPDTLKYFKSRILSTVITDDGLLFGMVESVALDSNGGKRGFRPVVFDVFGTVLERTNLEDSYKTREQAAKALYAIFDKTDAKAHTLKAISEQERRNKMDMQRLRAEVRAIGKKAVQS